MSSKVRCVKVPMPDISLNNSKSSYELSIWFEKMKKKIEILERRFVVKENWLLLYKTIVRINRLRKLKLFRNNMVRKRNNNINKGKWYSLTSRLIHIDFRRRLKEEKELGYNELMMKRKELHSMWKHLYSKIMIINMRKEAKTIVPYVIEAQMKKKLSQRQKYYADLWISLVSRYIAQSKYKVLKEEKRLLAVQTQRNRDDYREKWRILMNSVQKVEQQEELYYSCKQLKKYRHKWCNFSSQELLDMRILNIEEAYNKWISRKFANDDEIRKVWRNMARKQLRIKRTLESLRISHSLHVLTRFFKYIMYQKRAAKAFVFSINWNKSMRKVVKKSVIESANIISRSALRRSSFISSNFSYNLAQCILHAYSSVGIYHLTDKIEEEKPVYSRVNLIQNDQLQANSDIINSDEISPSFIEHKVNTSNGDVHSKSAKVDDPDVSIYIDNNPSERKESISPETLGDNLVEIDGNRNRPSKNTEMQKHINLQLHRSEIENIIPTKKPAKLLISEEQCENIPIKLPSNTGSKHNPVHSDGKTTKKASRKSFRLGSKSSKRRNGFITKTPDIGKIIDMFNSDSSLEDFDDSDSLDEIHINRTEFDMKLLYSPKQHKSSSFIKHQISDDDSIHVPTSINSYNNMKQLSSILAKENKKSTSGSQSDKLVSEVNLLELNNCTSSSYIPAKFPITTNFIPYDLVLSPSVEEDDQDTSIKFIFEDESPEQQFTASNTVMNKSDNSSSNINFNFTEANRTDSAIEFVFDKSQHSDDAQLVSNEAYTRNSRLMSKDNNTDSMSRNEIRNSLVNGNQRTKSNLAENDNVSKTNEETEGRNSDKGHLENNVDMGYSYYNESHYSYTQNIYDDSGNHISNIPKLRHQTSGLGQHISDTSKEGDEKIKQNNNSKKHINSVSNIHSEDQHSEIEIVDEENSDIAKEKFLANTTIDVGKSEYTSEEHLSNHSDNKVHHYETHDEYEDHLNDNNNIKNSARTTHFNSKDIHNNYSGYDYAYYSSYKTRSPDEKKNEDDGHSNKKSEISTYDNESYNYHTKSKTDANTHDYLYSPNEKTEQYTRDDNYENYENSNMNATKSNEYENANQENKGREDNYSSCETSRQDYDDGTAYQEEEEDTGDQYYTETLEKSDVKETNRQSEEEESHTKKESFEQGTVNEDERENIVSNKDNNEDKQSDFGYNVEEEDHNNKTNDVLSDYDKEFDIDFQLKYNNETEDQNDLQLFGDNDEDEYIHGTYDQEVVDNPRPVTLGNAVDGEAQNNLEENFYQEKDIPNSNDFPIELQDDHGSEDHNDHHDSSAMSNGHIDEKLWSISNGVKNYHESINSDVDFNPLMNGFSIELPEGVDDRPPAEYIDLDNIIYDEPPNTTMKTNNCEEEEIPEEIDFDILDDKNAVYDVDNTLKVPSHDGAVAEEYSEKSDVFNTDLSGKEFDLDSQGFNYDNEVLNEFTKETDQKETGNSPEKAEIISNAGEEMQNGIEDDYLNREELNNSFKEADYTTLEHNKLPENVSKDHPHEEEEIEELDDMFNTLNMERNDSIVKEDDDPVVDYQYNYEEKQMPAIRDNQNSQSGEVSSDNNEIPNELNSDNHREGNSEGLTNANNDKLPEESHPEFSFGDNANAEENKDVEYQTLPGSNMNQEVGENNIVSDIDLSFSSNCSIDPFVELEDNEFRVNSSDDHKVDNTTKSSIDQDLPDHIGRAETGDGSTHSIDDKIFDNLDLSFGDDDDDEIDIDNMNGIDVVHDQNPIKNTNPELDNSDDNIVGFNVQFSPPEMNHNQQLEDIDFSISFSDHEDEDQGRNDEENSTNIPRDKKSSDNGGFFLTGI